MHTYWITTHRIQGGNFPSRVCARAYHSLANGVLICCFSLPGRHDRCPSCNTLSFHSAKVVIGASASHIGEIMSGQACAFILVLCRVVVSSGKRWVPNSTIVVVEHMCWVVLSFFFFFPSSFGSHHLWLYPWPWFHCLLVYPQRRRSGRVSGLFVVGSGWVWVRVGVRVRV